MTDNTHNVFVYGTLREGAAATHFLPGFALVAYQGHDFAFPYAVPSSEFDIYGNIMAVDDAKLEQLDVYENVRNDLFVRKEIEVVDIATNESEIAWVYIAGPALFNVVDSGDWFDFLNKGN